MTSRTARSMTRTAFFLALPVAMACVPRSGPRPPEPLPEHWNEKEAVARSHALAIGVLQSAPFKAELLRIAETIRGTTPKYAAAWMPVDGAKIEEIARRAQTDSVRVYRGAGAWWSYRVYHTLAKEGAEDGPVLINHYGLPRTDASIAASIAHEMSHRVELHHPHSGEKGDNRACEPPYLIGTLVARELEGATWKRRASDCSLIEPLRRIVAVRPTLPTTKTISNAGLVAQVAQLPAEREPAPFITANMIEVACAKNVAELKELCEAKLSVTSAISITIPSAKEVAAAAGGTTTTPGKTDVRSQSMGLYGLTVPVDQGTLIVGFAQFAVTRAKNIGNVYLTQKFANGLCKERTTGTFAEYKALVEDKHLNTVADYLPSTCRLLASSKTIMGNGYSLPSFAVLQATMEQDLRGLGDVAVDNLRSRGEVVLAGMQENPSVARVADRWATAVGAARFAAILAHDPGNYGRAFSEAGADLVHLVQTACAGDAKSLVETCDPKWDRLPFSRDAAIVSSFLGVFDQAGYSAIMQGGTRRDSMLVLGLKALLVNGRPVVNSPAPFSRAFQDFARAHLGAAEVMADGQIKIEPNRLFVAAASTADSLRRATDKLAQALREANGQSAPMLKAYLAALPDFASAMAGFTDPTDPVAARTRLFVTRLALYPKMIEGHEYGALVTDLVTLVPDLAEGFQEKSTQWAVLHPRAMRAVQFVLDAEQSKTADEFQAVLESYAAPADAYLRKRAPHPGRFYGTLNTYVAAAGGFEQAVGSKVSEPTWQRHYGVSIPVGVELGLSIDKSIFGSIGVLFQAFDVGQVASWRARGNDTVKTAPSNLTFATILSPGANLVLNFKAPAAFGCGFAYAPQFRDLTVVTDNTAPRADARRISCFAGVDVTLFPGR
jgi:hypothetical protein